MTDLTKLADRIDPRKLHPDEIRRGTDGERLRYLIEHSVLADAASALRSMGWRKIEEAPAKPMPVLYFRGNLVFWETNPSKSFSADPAESSEPYRDERFDIGFWDGEAWGDNGTGHDCFEFEHSAMYAPTHWQPLPTPPETDHG